jgi:predicted phage tail protein
MFRVIKVYGKLAKHLGQRSFKAAVKTPAEAIRFLLANFPSLRSVISEGDYKVTVGRSELEIGNHPEYLHYPSASFETIRIVPVVAGAGGIGKILGGVALVALAIAAPYIAGAAVWSGALSYGAGSALIAAAPFIGGIGASLALGGIAQLLTPTPKISQGEDSTNDPRKSYSFSGIQNITRQGVPVPVIYGEVFTGSIVISAGINTEEVVS